MARYYYIGTRLRKLIDRMGWSIEDIGDHLRVLPKEVMLWLENDLPVQDELVRRLALHAGVDFAELLDEKGQFRDEQENQVFGFLTRQRRLDLMPRMLHLVRLQLGTRAVQGRALEDRDLRAILNVLLRQNRQ